MVAFDNLRLAGFKSFVEASEMAILPGLTGIVGPNGCGKSNLVEALRWVMGESSAKRLRGGEMDDVIFAGAAGRPARNQAEVTLRLANPDFNAPAQFNSANVLEVTRKVLRGQGSAYRVNGRDCRAQDLKLLFADLASGAASNAMVAQGRVAAIVNARPIDRRALLEEAAGITGLYSRRREAENRLRAADQNLARVSNMQETKRGQKRSLDRQALAAQRYSSLQEKRRALAALAMYLAWQQIEAELAVANGSLIAIESDCQRLEVAEATAKREEDAASAVLEPLRVRHAEASARVQRLELALDSLDGEERGLAIKQDNLTRQLNECGTDLAREQENVRVALERLKNLETDETEVKERKSKLDSQIANLDTLLGEAEITEQMAADALNTCASKFSIVQNEFRAQEQQIKNLEDRAQKLATRLNALSQVTHSLDLTPEDIDEKITQQVEGQSQLAAQQSELEAKQEARSLAQTALAAAIARRQSLIQQEVELRAEAQGLKALLGTIAPQETDILTLAKSIEVEPGFAPQVAAALGDGLSAPLDHSRGDYWRAYTLPSPPDLPPDAVSLAAAVANPAWVPSVLAYVGQVESAQKALDLQTKLRPGQALTTPDGGLWRWDGFVVSADRSEAQATLINQKQRLSVLERALDDLEPNLSDAHNKELQAKSALEEQTRHVAERERKIRDHQKALAQLGREVADAQRKIAEHRAKVAAQEAEYAGTQREQETVEAELSGLRQVKTSSEILAQLETQVNNAREALETAKANVRNSRTRLEQAKRELISADARLGSILTESFTFEGQYNNSAAQVRVLNDRAKSLEIEASALAERPAQLEKQRTDLSASLTEARDAQALAGDALAAAENKSRGLRASAQGAVQAYANVREVRARRIAEQASVQDRFGVVARQAYEQFKRPASDLLALANYKQGDKLPDETTIKEQMAQLDRQIDKIGPVNLMAATELKDLETQLDTLDNEVSDLTKAVTKLRRVIAELNQEGRARLKDSFDQVSTHFSELFQLLFGGGKARIELVGSEDPLQAGLEVIASPPGKRLQSLTLLSGGEQTLTALALVFAMFRANPAPLCVLDEVDAPLDDANVERMCRLLEEIAAEIGTRFLIVTHNALTMARVDRLYGVTMADPGVSRLVSVNLAEASNYGN